MVWDCFGFYVIGNLVVLPKNITLKRIITYICLTVLLECCGRCQADLFMQDSAPCHSAMDVKQLPCDCDVSFYADWPGHSSDLNPSENLWGLVKRALRGKDTS